jgi:hypothetical protein
MRPPRRTSENAYFPDVGELGQEDEGPRPRSPQPSEATGVIFCNLQDLKEWRDPESNRGHHDFQSCAEAFRYAGNSHT